MCVHVCSCTHTCLTAESHALVFVLAVQWGQLVAVLWRGLRARTLSRLRGLPQRPEDSVGLLLIVMALSLRSVCSGSDLGPACWH